MLKKIIATLLLLSSLNVFGETLNLGSHGTFTMDVPANWKFFSQPVQDKGYVVGLQPASGESAGLKISLIYPPQPRPADEAKLKEDLLRICDQYVGASVEKVKTLKEYGVKSGFGQYAVFTDESLVGKPDTANEFKIISPGLIQMTDGVIAMLTGVAQDAKGPEFTAILAAIKSIEIKPAKPVPTAP